ncbi:EAL domain-containing protein [Priestia megaterium]|nr:EAL domain-containing protein [Priestia megaterium]
MLLSSLNKKGGGNVSNTIGDTFALDSIVFLSLFVIFICAFIFVVTLLNQKMKEQRMMKGAIFEKLLDPIIVINESGHVVEMNPIAYKWFSAHLLGRSIKTIFPHLQLVDLIVGQRTEQVIHDFKGQEKTVELTISAVETETVKEYLFYMRNITEQKEYWNELIETNERYERLFHSSPLAIVVHRGGKIVSVNEETLRIIGVKNREELVDHGLNGFVIEEDQEMVRQAINQFEENGISESLVNEVRIRHSAGNLLHLETKSNIIRIKGEKYIQTILKDITEEQKAAETLIYTAYRDQLTGLPNKVVLDTVGKNMIKRAKKYDIPLAMVYMDIDRFRFVNETYGHELGDLLLKEVVKRVQSIMGPSAILARYGSNGFLLLMRYEQQEEVINLTTVILTRIQLPFHFNDLELFVSISMGVSLYPKNALTLELLIRQAEAAMYHTKKHNHRHIAFYETAMKQSNTRKMMLENELHQAVQNEELELYYQPKVDIQHQTISAMEALLRWNHPRLGQISPEEFIPIAEETGLIVPISEWVLKTACLQNKRWQQAGIGPMRVAVNISSVEFGEDLFISKVMKALKEADLHPMYLELEITESVAIKTIDVVIEKLNLLKGLGVYLSIDDFGSGYSSLSYIKKFPINALKIDRLFIRDVMHSKEEIAIVEAIITLAKSLELEVVAEGVETKDQVKLLNQAQCDEIQGYYFSKPVSAREFERSYQTLLTHIKAI